VECKGSVRTISDLPRRSLSWAKRSTVTVIVSGAGFKTRFRREKAEGRGEAKAERRRRIPTGDTPRSENAGIARLSGLRSRNKGLEAGS